jgi:putative membrane protein
MRFIRYIFLALVALVLVVVALANRGAVTLRLVPDEFVPFLPMPNEFTLPLFVVIFGAIIVGLLIGFVWEWFREHALRAEAARRKRELNQLEREVKGLRDKTGEGKDDVLALLD